MMNVGSQPYVSWEVNNESFAIRQALHTDVEAIVSLVNEAYSEQEYGFYRKNNGKGEGSRTSPDDIIKRIQKNHKYTLFVCVKKGDKMTQRDQVVGTIYLKHHHTEKVVDVGDVCMFAILSKYRKAFRIGSHLLQTVEIEARKNQLNALCLYVVDANGEQNQVRLIKYYVNNGYAVTGEKFMLMHRAFKSEVAVLKMEKKLPSILAAITAN